MLLMVTTPSAPSWKPCWAAILPGKVKVQSPSTASTVSGFDFARFFLLLPWATRCPGTVSTSMDPGNPGKHPTTTGKRRIQISNLIDCIGNTQNTFQIRVSRDATLPVPTVGGISRISSLEPKDTSTAWITNCSLGKTKLNKRNSTLNKYWQCISIRGKKIQRQLQIPRGEQIKANRK